MPTTFSSREFNHNTNEAKKAALEGPVFITDRGKAAHVLLSIEEYRRLIEPQPSVIDALAIPEDEVIEFDVHSIQIHTRPADLS